MGVYIKGMEMPKSCNLCPFEFSGDCLLNRDIICTYEPVTRSSNCPLVPVPPHGRLIDADAELERLKNCMFPSDMATTTAVGMYEKWLKNAPTIIEAEEGEWW